MATYRLYPDRNAWTSDNRGVSVEIIGSLATAKTEADALGFRYIEALDTPTLRTVCKYASSARWSRA